MPSFVIDDVFGDERPDSHGTVPQFLPIADGQWDGIGGTCDHACGAGADFLVPIDASKVQGGTWHTVSVNPREPETTISINFNGMSTVTLPRRLIRFVRLGTSISVYCLLPPYLGQHITTFMNVSFILDGIPVSSTYTRPTMTPDTQNWTYNASIYDSPQLANTEHAFIVQPLPGDNNSFLAFDYFQYE